MTNQLSKSARRRARRKKITAGAQPVAPVMDQIEPERPAQTGGNSRTVTIEMPARHWLIWDWLTGNAGLDKQGYYVAQVLRSHCMKVAPKYREEHGGGGATGKLADFKDPHQG